MKQEEAIIRLRHKGVGATANRILVLKKLEEEQRPMSLSSLEAAMPNMDKSSIFRVLNYELCANDGACHHNDGHIHFYCETCHQSFCLDDIHVPQFSLPSGFVARSMSFVIKGQCEKCSKKRKG